MLTLGNGGGCRYLSTLPVRSDLEFLAFSSLHLSGPSVCPSYHISPYVNSLPVTFLLYRALHLPPSTARITSFRDGVKRVDLLGMLMIVLSLSFVIVSLNLGGQTLPWNAPTIIGCFSASFVSFVAFVVVENFAELPVAPMHLFVQWRWRNVPIMIGVFLTS